MKRRLVVIFSNIYDRTIFNWVVIEYSTQEWFFWLTPKKILIGVNENGFFCCIFRNSDHFLKLLCTITDKKNFNKYLTWLIVWMTQECNSISVWNWSEISLWSSRSTLSFSFSNIFSAFALRSNNRVNASFKSVWSKTHNFSSSKIGWIIISSTKLEPYAWSDLWNSFYTCT